MADSANRPKPALGPADARLTVDDLPPPDVERWITQRKAALVAAVRRGLIGLDEACARYAITHEEFVSWQRLLDEHGMNGLRVTRLQQYRRVRGAGDPAPVRSGAAVEDG